MDIQEDKIVIQFINRNKVLYKVRIPVSINKSDLYSIAEKYKSFYLNNILLIHKNSIIDKDESSIKFISNGDTIIIVEDRYYQDNTYYNSLIENNNSKDMINIELSGDISHKFIFPENITFSEMKKAIYFSIDKDNRELLFYDYRSVNDNDKIKEIFKNKITKINTFINGKIIGGAILNYGKKINLNIIPGDLVVEIGILNSNKKLLSFVELMIGQKVKKIYIKEKEINITEEKSLISLGIKEDCKNCKVELGESIKYY